MMLNDSMRIKRNNKYGVTGNHSFFNTAFPDSLTILILILRTLFHLIIFFLPLSTQSPEWRTKGRRWGMGPPDSGVGSVPDPSGPWSRGEPLNAPGSQEGR